MYIHNIYIHTHLHVHDDESRHHICQAARGRRALPGRGKTAAGRRSVAKVSRRRLRGEFVVITQISMRVNLGL